MRTSTYRISLSGEYPNRIYHNGLYADTIGLDDGETVTVDGEDKVGVTGCRYQSESKAFAVGDIDDG
jgi:hypothetical protein